MIPDSPTESQYKRFQWRIAIWAAAWFAAIPIVLWLADWASSHLLGSQGLIAFIAIPVLFGFAPPLFLVKLAFGSYATYPARLQKALDKARARRMGPDSSDSVRNWSIFTKLLVILFFGSFAVLGFWGFASAPHLWWFLLPLGILGLVVPALVLWLWFFQKGAKDSKKAELKSLVATRIDALRRLKPSAIAALPKTGKETVPSPKGKVGIYTYHDLLHDGGHMVIVQALREHWFGISTAIYVEGFVSDAEGKRRLLDEKEKWPFL